MSESSEIPKRTVDVAVVGCGAAGLMAAIQAGRAAGAGALDIVALDSQPRLGRKILIAGGGRCNVTNRVVKPRDFAGAPHGQIRRVLTRFTVAQTCAFFAELGVEFVVEQDTGKYFPSTQKARTVLEALLKAADQAGVTIVHPFRIEQVERGDESSDGTPPPFLLRGPQGVLRARRLVLSTGGKSVPATGSDGHGYALACGLGHELTPHLLPSLVPLLLPQEHPLLALRGISLPAALVVRTPGGKQLARADGPLLLTHLGLSGPSALDISRHLLVGRATDPALTLHIHWLPEEDRAALDRWLQPTAGARVEARLAERFPKRLAAALARLAGVAPDAPLAALSRQERQALVAVLDGGAVPIIGDRGFAVAEVTAGGIPLDQVSLKTLESRRCPGLYFCGEILDVDGRIGGFNFQWAWASGTTVGQALAVADRQ